MRVQSYPFSPLEIKSDSSAFLLNVLCISSIKQNRRVSYRSEAQLPRAPQQPQPRSRRIAFCIALCDVALLDELGRFLDRILKTGFGVLVHHGDFGNSYACVAGQQQQLDRLLKGTLPFMIPSTPCSDLLKRYEHHKRTWKLTAMASSSPSPPSTATSPP